MTPANKIPREFWVRPRRIGKGPTWNATESPSAYSGYNDSIHLIEHSAYLAVKQELEAARADAKKNQIILDNLKDAPYWELQKQLADAKAELKQPELLQEKLRDYESALEKINKEELNSQRPGGGYSASAKISYEALNKWSRK